MEGIAYYEIISYVINVYPLTAYPVVDFLFVSFHIDVVAQGQNLQLVIFLVKAPIDILDASGLKENLGIFKPRSVGICINGQLDSNVEVLACYCASAVAYNELVAVALGVYVYVGYDFYLGGAAVVIVLQATPSIGAGVASRKSKGGSHGENHDQSQSDCKNLFHFL
ncbi:MAG: hypothetical protein IJB30_06375 [Clostridia bacterium]|nr:hypothetical protein [Clostridia bacterium]